MRSELSQRKRSLFFARKAIKRRNQQRYREVEPGVFIKTI